MINNSLGRYQIKSELGRGGMAAVYLALDPTFNRQVAVKVLPRHFLHDQQFRSRFLREAQTVARLEHPAIVPVYDFGEEDGQPFLVMRFMSGGTLLDRIGRGPMPAGQVAGILRRLGSALDYAHSQGIVHRDLKPANVLFDQHGNAFLTDFGIVKLAEATVALTGAGILGTPGYMSPEQVQGEGKIDGRTDVYALGIMSFEMLTGRPPFQADTPAKLMMAHVLNPAPDIRSIRKDLPAGLQTVIARALAKKRDERFSTAGEMASALGTLATTAAPIKPPAAQPEAPRVASGKSPEMVSTVLEDPALPAAVDLPETSIDAIPAGRPSARPAQQGPSRRPRESAAPRPAEQVVAPAPSISAVAHPSRKRVSARVFLLIPAIGVFLCLIGIIVAILMGANFNGPDKTLGPTGSLYGAIAYSPDGQMLYGGGWGGSVWIWQPQSGLFDQTVDGFGDDIRDLMVTDDGRVMILSQDFEQENPSISLWFLDDSQSGEPYYGHTDFILDEVLSEGGQKLATGSIDKTARVWDTATGELLQRFVHDASVSNLAFSKDGRLLATSSVEVLTLWNLDNGDRLWAKNASGPVFSLSFSPDGAMVVAGEKNRLVTRRVTDGETLLDLQAFRVNDVVQTAVSPDNEIIATADAESQVKLWSAADGQQLARFEWPWWKNIFIRDLAFSPDGQTIATAGHDGRIRLWDVP